MAEAKPKVIPEFGLFRESSQGVKTNGSKIAGVMRIANANVTDERVDATVVTIGKTPRYGSQMLTTVSDDFTKFEVSFPGLHHRAKHNRWVWQDITLSRWREAANGDPLLALGRYWTGAALAKSALAQDTYQALQGSLERKRLIGGTIGGVVLTGASLLTGVPAVELGLGLAGLWSGAAVGATCANKREAALDVSLNQAAAAVLRRPAAIEAMTSLETFGY